MAPHPLFPLFSPQHILVIGASEKAGSLGEQLLSTLLHPELQAKLTPINLQHKIIGGLTAYPTIGRLPESADLAVILTPPATYDSLFRACLKHQIRTAVLMQPWHQFSTEEQLSIEKSLHKAHKQGLNIALCQADGLSSPAYGLHLSLSQQRPSNGSLALISQDHTLHHQLPAGTFGISKHISLHPGLNGITTASILDYLSEDTHTRQVIVQYPAQHADQAFFSALQHIARHKPTVLHANNSLSETELAFLQHQTQRNGILLTHSPNQIQAAAHLLVANPSPFQQLHATGNTQTGWLHTHTPITGLTKLTTQSLPDNPSTQQYRNHLHSLLADKHTEAVLTIIEPTIHRNEAEIHRHLSHIQQHTDKPLFIVSAHADQPLQFQQAEQALLAIQLLHTQQHLKQTAQQLPQPQQHPIPPTAPGQLKKLSAQPEAALQALDMPLNPPADTGYQLHFTAHPKLGPLLHIHFPDQQTLLTPPFSGLDIAALEKHLPIPSAHPAFPRLLGILNQTIATGLPIQSWQFALDPHTATLSTTHIEFGTRIIPPINAFPTPPLPPLTLKNNTRCIIRAIQPHDAAKLQQFIRQLSATSRKNRFMSALTELPPAILARFCRPDYSRECVLIAEDGDGKIIALAQYTCERAAEYCEFGIAIADTHQGQGLAQPMMQALIHNARQQGYRTMSANILTSNSAMLHLAGKLGFHIEASPHDRKLSVANLPLTTLQNRLKNKLTQQILAPKA